VLSDFVYASEVWRSPLKASHPSDKLQGLAIQLERLADFAETEQIIWQMRQICLRRRLHSHEELPFFEEPLRVASSTST
jgi:hypothetical protein